MSTLITRGIDPGTGTSRAHSRGTRLSPSRRAATAGNSASRSCVSVKMQLTIASATRLLRSISARMSSSVAARIASASLHRTLLAPRSAKRRKGLLGELQLECLRGLEGLPVGRIEAVLAQDDHGAGDEAQDQVDRDQNGREM